MESKQKPSGFMRYAKYLIILCCLPPIVILGGDAALRISNGNYRVHPYSTALYVVITLVCLLDIVMGFRNFDKIKARAILIANAVVVACSVVVLSDHPNMAIMVLIAALPLVPLGIIAKCKA